MTWSHGFPSWQAMLIHVDPLFVGIYARHCNDGFEPHKTSSTRPERASALPRYVCKHVAGKPSTLLPMHWNAQKCEPRLRCILFDFSNALSVSFDQWCEWSSGDASETWMLATLLFHTYVELPPVSELWRPGLSNARRHASLEYWQIQIYYGHQAEPVYAWFRVVSITLMLVKLLSKGVVFIPVMKYLTLCWPISALSWYKSLMCTCKLHRFLPGQEANGKAGHQHHLSCPRTAHKCCSLPSHPCSMFPVHSIPFLSYLYILVNMSKL